MLSSSRVRRRRQRTDDSSASAATAPAGSPIPAGHVPHGPKLHRHSSQTHGPGRRGSSGSSGASMAMPPVALARLASGAVLASVVVSSAANSPLSTGETTPTNSTAAKIRHALLDRQRRAELRTQLQRLAAALKEPISDSKDGASAADSTSPNPAATGQTMAHAELVLAACMQIKKLQAERNDLQRRVEAGNLALQRRMAEVQALAAEQEMTPPKSDQPGPSTTPPRSRDSSDSSSTSALQASPNQPLNLFRSYIFSASGVCALKLGRGDRVLACNELYALTLGWEMGQVQSSCIHAEPMRTKAFLVPPELGAFLDGEELSPESVGAHMAEVNPMMAMMQALNNTAAATVAGTKVSTTIARERDFSPAFSTQSNSTSSLAAHPPPLYATQSLLDAPILQERELQHWTTSVSRDPYAPTASISTSLFDHLLSSLQCPTSTSTTPPTSSPTPLLAKPRVLQLLLRQQTSWGDIQESVVQVLRVDEDDSEPALLFITTPATRRLLSKQKKRSRSQQPPQQVAPSVNPHQPVKAFHSQMEMYPQLPQMQASDPLQMQFQIPQEFQAPLLPVMDFSKRLPIGVGMIDTTEDIPMWV